MNMAKDHRTLSDDELLGLIAENDDQDAFLELIERYQQKVYRLCFRYLNKIEDAEDMTQKVLFKVYQNAPSYDAKGYFSSFLYRLATNACLNYKRDEKKRRFTSLDSKMSDEGSTLLVDLLPGAMTPPSVRIRRVEQQAQLQEALQTLPERQRLALLLRMEFKADYSDIAIAMEATTEAVEQLIYRARQNLINKVDKIFKDE
jgi:RNA polymerase sigma-70 factor (ECF subfamily)